MDGQKVLVAILSAINFGLCVLAFYITSPSISGAATLISFPLVIGLIIFLLYKHFKKSDNIRALKYADIAFLVMSLVLAAFLYLKLSNVSIRAL
ncbi:MAG: hypothetical protein V1859_11330 [archaeon]